MILTRMRGTVPFVNARLIISNVPTIAAFQCPLNVTELTIVETTQMRFSVPVPKERTCLGKWPFLNDVMKNWTFLELLSHQSGQKVKKNAQCTYVCNHNTVSTFLET